MSKCSSFLVYAYSTSIGREIAFFAPYGKITFQKEKHRLFIKVVIAFVALWFIYREVQLKDQETDIGLGISFLLKPTQIPVLLGLTALMFLNWVLEAAKWRLLVSQIERISLWKSLKAIFSGITIAIFTPNRVGEYGGRIFHLKTADRIDRALLTIVGSYAQLVVTLTTESLPLFSSYLSTLAWDL